MRAALAGLGPDATPKQVKKAGQVVKKAEKRLAKMRRLVGKQLTKLSAAVGKIEEIDPDHFAVQGPVSDGVTDVPVVIQEAVPADGNPLARPGAVATFGLPFSRDAAVPVVLGRPRLGVLGSDAYQFRVLDTWPEGTVRWALCDVLTDLEAGEWRDDLTVVAGPGLSAQPLVGQRSEDHILLDTGPMQIIVGQQGVVPFHAVTVDDELVVFGGAELPGLVGRGVGGELLLPSPQSKPFLEENGPVRAVVRTDGALLDEQGQGVVDYSLRVTARRGQREVDVEVTVRNANILRPRHVQIESLELIARVLTQGAPRVRVSAHDGEFSSPLAPSDASRALLYQGYSDARTQGLGSPQYLPHLPLQPGSFDEFLDQGYLLEVGGVVHRDLGDSSLYPRYPYLDLSGTQGGLTVSLHKMPFLWPAALSARGDGLVSVGLFPAENRTPFTFAWKQHESRKARLSFHRGEAVLPRQVSRRLEQPVTGRAADYGHYDRSGTFAYRLLTLPEHAQALSLMGIDHVPTVSNPQQSVTRYLYKGTTGGSNNHAKIERELGGDWLRHGRGGDYLNSLDLALYKAEWQIERSDNFHDEADPGASNEDLPHSTGYRSDDEHRYREGLVLAHFLTGDNRFKAALHDEAELLPSVSLWQHERSMYQTLRAMAIVGEFTADASLRDVLRHRLAYITQPELDVHQQSGGFGWDGPPGLGTRGYYVDSATNDNEKPPGENFQARGFISASLGPLGFFHAARVLPPSSYLAAASRGRLRDLAWWTRNELYPTLPNLADQRLAYSYAVTLQQITQWENVDFHPILLGMAEAYLDTGEAFWLEKGVEQLRAAEIHGDLHRWDTRLDVQHFLSVYRDHVLGL